MWAVVLLCGIGMLLLSVLPTETRLVRFVSVAVILTLICGSGFNAEYTYSYAQFQQVRDDCSETALELGHSCWVHLLIVCAFGACTVVWSVSVGWLLKVIWSRPSSRLLLDSLWRAVGFSYMAYAIAQVRGAERQPHGSLSRACPRAPLPASASAVHSSVWLPHGISLPARCR